MDAPRYRVVVEVNAESVKKLGIRLHTLGALLMHDPTVTEHIDNGDAPGDVNHELHVYDMKEAPGL